MDSNGSSRFTSKGKAEGISDDYKSIRNLRHSFCVRCLLGRNNLRGDSIYRQVVVVTVNPSKGNVMLATELYAISQRSECNGNESCHWCGAPCERSWFHDEPAPYPFVKTHSNAKRPSSPWICKGCYLFRRQSITVKSISGTSKDRQCPLNHSWWITEKDAISIDKPSYLDLYAILLNPPKRFCLSLIDGTVQNRIHLAFANDFIGMSATTPIAFTINNVPFSYSVYELQEAIETETTGKEPGVRELIAILGRPCEVKQVARNDSGRYSKEVIGKKVRQVIHQSGALRPQ